MSETCYTTTTAQAGEVSVCASIMKINGYLENNLCACEVVHKICKQESISTKEQVNFQKFEELPNRI